ncbi:SDR family oxidoreductase [Rathayibacter toxicus]|uniref:SDR family NAD(P)-dependent oxidoreductase n=1 Tax=Rathayibacter toxicus TaxID=145458 RepID=A0A0C5BDU1_9MICO|nr:SDR family oxidoreductase [Rathayibacter toxicus]AJM77139.1 short-chain dehydrogenase [Rathayibacter toxicus]ALS57020.1 short-chain dehydrogenase [Rathayibacter toxicus]KKM46152.1 short-chain dehydrogenase [Rathayibacter toxicus]PPG23106.1 SDR family NAD(P)-dependent oxidoreductase [Rathayibacter toxicus]PPG47689.1 SDR family NAD(P)-dependent oxidoreductase [Rathayibacter toxicus]
MPRPLLLVTGSSTGIGRATVIEAARSGWSVVASVLDLEDTDGLRAAIKEARVTVDIRQLDVTDTDSIDTCLREIEEEHGSLDGLVNNAGVGHLGITEFDDSAQLRRVMEVNFFGTVALTRAALPQLRCSRGRIVTVSSVAGIIGQPFSENYCASQFALEGFFETLAPVAASVGVQVSLIEPGPVRSGFIHNTGIDVGAVVTRAGPYAPALTAYLDRVTSSFASSYAQDPSEVAAVIVATLRDPEPPLRRQTSEWAHGFVARKLSDTDGSTVASAIRGWIGSH